jgi:hypothetical protein
MKIIIETIPHDQHRYETVGDWWFEKPDTLQIRVSAMGDWKKEACVAVHELVEVLICKYDGVSQESVDAFDQNYEALRPEGDTSEPGDDPRAPYTKQHCIATGVERLLCAALGLSWKEYDDTVEFCRRAPSDSIL